LQFVIGFVLKLDIVVQSVLFASPVDHNSVSLSKTNMPPRAKAHILFYSAIILLFVGGLATFLTISELLSAQQWVAHTREVQFALSRVNTAISRAGRTRTEYVDSGNPSQLQEHQLALTQIPATITELRHLVSDNSSQRNRVAELERLIDQRISLMRQSVALRQSNQSTLENQSRITQSIVSVAAEMDATMQAMEDQEQILLEARNSRVRRREQLAAVLLCSTFAIALVLFILHYRLLNKELEGRQQAELSLRTLSARILRIQDEERRRFSRELHDSLGQYLVGAKMNLEMLDNSIPNNSLLADSKRLIDDALAETRTISHLLHPPLLDEAGFASAASFYVEGFSKRSGIATRLDMPDDFGRLPAPVEIVLFRVLQEGLTNIHKHSRSSKSEVSVSLESGKVCLKIQDNGKGIPATVLERFRSDGVQHGVGLAGMRERIRELGGYLDIRSGSTGTLITALLPTVENRPVNVAGDPAGDPKIRTMIIP
jgi:signal transduction histidine kinase